MEVVDLLLKLLSLKSITPDDGGILQFIENYLSDFKSIYINKNGVKNLFLYKKYNDSGKHLCFAGHVDVVPAGEGWSSNPFIPMIKGELIYGRGTQDMKSGVASFVQAVKDSENQNGIISIMLTSDEEGEALYGTKIILEHLKSINLLPDECIVAEPTCEKIFGDTIKIGRRGSINGVLTVQGVQGHAAYPEKCINPIHQTSSILPKIAGLDLDNGDENFSPSKFIITDIRSGMEVTNVTPNILKMMFNIRNSTKTSKKSIENIINNYFSKLDYKLELNQSSYPFLTDNKSNIVKKISNSISEIIDVKTSLSTAGGTSDGRFIAQYNIDVVEFGVINDRIHSIDERVSISEVENLYQIFLKLISLN